MNNVYKNSMNYRRDMRVLAKTIQPVFIFEIGLNCMASTRITWQYNLENNT